jgi:predicted MFS family arabinose efflux permease
MNPGPRRFQRLWSLVLLFAVGVLNLFDRQIINVLAQDIKIDLHISDVQLGMLTGTAFGLLYSILGVPLGWLADRVNRVSLIVAALAIWSGFTCLCAATGSYSQLFLARMGVGIGEAGSQPASTALIPDLFAKNRRTSAMSLMLAGAPVGSFLGLLVGGLVGSIWGWRTAFLVAGAPGLCLAAVTAATMRDPGPVSDTETSTLPDNGRGAETSLADTLLMLIRQPGYAWLVLGNICSAFLVYATGVWLPPLFIRVHGMSTAEIGAYAAVAVGLGGALGTLGAGAVCDALRTRITEVESKLLMAVLAVSVPMLLITVLSTHRLIALISMFAFNVCAFAFLGPTVILTQRASTPETRALSVAILVSTGNVLSLAGGVPLVGLLSDTLTPVYGQDAIRYALAYGTMPGCLGVLAHWQARNRLRAANSRDCRLPCVPGVPRSQAQP